MKINNTNENILLLGLTDEEEDIILERSKNILSKPHVDVEKYIYEIMHNEKIPDLFNNCMVSTSYTSVTVQRIKQTKKYIRK